MSWFLVASAVAGPANHVNDRPHQDTFVYGPPACFTSPTFFYDKSHTPYAAYITSDIRASLNTAHPRQNTPKRKLLHHAARKEYWLRR
jgi:hypothetical protein